MESAHKDQRATQPTIPEGAHGERAHGEPASVVLNLADPEFMTHAFTTYADLRDKGSLVRVSVPALENADKDAQQGAFRDIFGRDAIFVARYEEAVAALLDERLSVAPQATMTPEEIKAQPPMPEEFKPFARSLLSVDAPDHSRLRKLVQPSFAAHKMEALRPRIQRIADDLLDEAERAAEARGESAPNRRMDLREVFAYPLPVTVISDMVGIPLEDRSKVRVWTEKFLSNRRAQGFTKESRAHLREFIAYLHELFAAKRQSPSDDMISQLVHAQEDGDKLDDDELLSMIFIIYIAGHVTTVNLIGNGVFGLLTHPTELARLKADPALARGVVEETLRCWGPLDTIMRRIATEDLEIGGTKVAKGERLMVGLASANYDPKRFEKPEDFDISRADASRHIAFGKGVHLCLGAPLARIEGQIAFETLVRRYPELRLAVPAAELNWTSSFLRGFTALPLLF